MLERILNDTSLLASIVATLAVGVLGAIAGYWIRPTRTPRFGFTRATLQTRLHPEVSISFRGQPVDNLRVLKFAFWNAGRTEIRAEDVPDASPPYIEFANGTRIFSVTSSPSEPATRATLAPVPSADHRLAIRFNYLNHFDGVFAEILYSLPASLTEPEFRVGGAIKGGRSIRGREFPHDTDQWSSLFFACVSLCFALYIAQMLFLRGSLVVVLLGVVLTAFFAVPALLLFRQFHSLRAPTWVRNKFPLFRGGIFHTTEYRNAVPRTGEDVNGRTHR